MTFMELEETVEIIVFYSFNVMDDKAVMQGVEWGYWLVIGKSGLRNQGASRLLRKEEEEQGETKEEEGKGNGERGSGGKLC